MRIPVDVWNAAAAHYDEGQLIEFVGVIGLFNYFNRFNNALEIEVTRRYHVFCGIANQRVDIICVIAGKHIPSHALR